MVYDCVTTTTITKGLPYDKVPKMRRLNFPCKDPGARRNSRHAKLEMPLLQLPALQYFARRSNRSNRRQNRHDQRAEALVAVRQPHDSTGPRFAQAAACAISFPFDAASVAAALRSEAVVGASRAFSAARIASLFEAKYRSTAPGHSPPTVCGYESKQLNVATSDLLACAAARIANNTCRP